METLAALGHGFAVALIPCKSVLWSALGVTVGTASRARRASARRSPCAALLPVTYNLEPTSAFIMFAGIYYRRHVRRLDHLDLLNTPANWARLRP